MLYFSIFLQFIEWPFHVLVLCLTCTGISFTYCVHTNGRDIMYCVHTHGRDFMYCVHTHGRDFMYCVHTNGRYFMHCVHTVSYIKIKLDKLKCLRITEFLDFLSIGQLILPLDKSYDIRFITATKLVQLSVTQCHLSYVLNRSYKYSQ